MVILSGLHKKLANLDFATSIRDTSLVILSTASLFTFTNSYLELYYFSSAVVGILVYVVFSSSEKYPTKRNNQSAYNLIGFLCCIAIFSHLANIPFVILSIFLTVKNANQYRDLIFLFTGFGIGLLVVFSLIISSGYPLIDANLRGGGDGMFFNNFDEILNNASWSIFVSCTAVLLPLVSLITIKVINLNLPRPTLTALISLIMVYSAFELLYDFDLGYIDLDLRLLPALGLTAASLPLLNKLRQDQKIEGRKVLLLLTCSAIINIIFQIKIIGLSVNHLSL